MKRRENWRSPQLISKSPVWLAFADFLNRRSLTYSNLVSLFSCHGRGFANSGTEKDTNHQPAGDWQDKSLDFAA